MSAALGVFADAFEWIRRHGQPTTVEVDGRTYGDGRLQLMAAPAQDTIDVHTLEGLVAFLDHNATLPLTAGAENEGRGLAELVLVQDEARVSVLGAPSRVTGERPVLLYARAWPTEAKGKPAFNEYMSQDAMVTRAQTCLVDSPERERLLRIVGTMREAKEYTSDDDGVTQRVTASAGLRLGEVAIENPFLLAPWATFDEIDQPERAFVLRARGGSEEAAPKVMLAEVEDPKWRGAAARAIANWITAETANGRVSILW